MTESGRRAPAPPQAKAALARAYPIVHDASAAGHLSEKGHTELLAALGHADCIPRAHSMRERTLNQRTNHDTEAEVARLRDLVEEFLESHPSGEHYWHADPEGLPSGWCKECISEWPCLIERARTALHGEDDDDDG